MALSKKDLQELGGLIDKAIKRAVDIGRKSGTNHYKETERRLFRYPELKKNIGEYKADIEDIKQENLGKSKDIIKFSIHGGNTPQEDIEEKRQKLIENLESRIASDSFEIRQIERALERVKNDEHYPIIVAYYFEKCDMEKLEKRFHYSERTIRRYRKNLVNIISDALYGAEDTL